MTKNQRCKKYLEKHHSAIENWQNQRHRMHIIQYNRIVCSKHAGSKSLKRLLQSL